MPPRALERDTDQSIRAIGARPNRDPWRTEQTGQVAISLSPLACFTFLTLAGSVLRLPNQTPFIRINKYAEPLLTLILYICFKPLFVETNLSLISGLLVWLPDK